MKIEHIALNVVDPISIANWYVKNIGLKIVKEIQTAPFIRFLADSSGRVMVELYNNTNAPILNYSEMNPLVLHLAFVSTDPIRDKNNLLNAGATLESEQKLEDGSHIIMLRDPWGLAIQLCKRSIPLLSEWEILEKKTSEVIN